MLLLLIFYKHVSNVKTFSKDNNNGFWENLRNDREIPKLHAQPNKVLKPNKNIHP